MTKEPIKYILTFLICIIFSCQIGKSKTGMQQSKDVESTIKICIKEKICFSIQLLNFFSEEGNYKLLCVKRNGRHLANVKLPSSEDVKNLKTHIRKYRNNCILECLYGGGDNLYSRHFYFRCKKDNLYLYKVVSKHIVPNVDKKEINEKCIQPLINIRNFKVLHYLDNTP